MTTPGVTKVCFLPSFDPPAHEVELISISGQSLAGVWAWNAVLERMVCPSSRTLLTGKAPASVDCTSNQPQPFPAASVGVTTALTDPFLYWPVGTLPARKPVTMALPSFSGREKKRYFKTKE